MSLLPFSFTHFTIAVEWVYAVQQIFSGTIIILLRKSLWQPNQFDPAPIKHWNKTLTCWRSFLVVIVLRFAYHIKSWYMDFGTSKLSELQKLLVALCSFYQYGRLLKLCSLITLFTICTLLLLVFGSGCGAFAFVIITIHWHPNVQVKDIVFHMRHRFRCCICVLFVCLYIGPFVPFFIYR